jgi:hypothetical protein
LEVGDEAAPDDLHRPHNPSRKDAKDEVIRELQEEVDRLTETVAEMAAETPPTASSDSNAAVEWDRQGELTSALAQLEHETEQRKVFEARVKAAEAWEKETLLTPEQLVAGKTPEITEDLRDRLLKTLATALHPTATQGAVVAAMRGFHRVAFGCPLEQLIDGMPPTKAHRKLSKPKQSATQMGRAIEMPPPPA